jgi:hypothetical protein
VGKPRVAGVYTNQRLSLSAPREGPWKIGQGFKPDSGNLTVRDYRGASGNVRHGENVNPARDRKSGSGNPSPTAWRVRFLSQWGGSLRLGLGQPATVGTQHSTEGGSLRAVARARRCESIKSGICERLG